MEKSNNSSVLRSAHIIKNQIVNRSNSKLEITKGLTALAASALLIQILLEQENVHTPLLCFLHDSKQRVIPRKTTVAYFLNAHVYKLLFSQNPKEHLNTYVHRLVRNGSIIAAVGAYIFGKYGITTLYSALKNRTNSQEELNDLKSSY